MFEEAEANRAAGKYDNSSINEQVDFYIKEGLQPYSEAKLPITSGRSFHVWAFMCTHGCLLVYAFFSMCLHVSALF